MHSCSKCQKPTSTFVYSKTLDLVVCRQCKIDAGDKYETGRGIFDATGKRRDRDWLRDKLEMTRTDKRWKEDIMSRRRMPDGSIRRIKK